MPRSNECATDGDMCVGGVITPVDAGLAPEVALAFALAVAMAEGTGFGLVRRNGWIEDEEGEGGRCEKSG